MLKLNNKGYMLIEIILASVVAFGVAFFIVNLTIKLKNKNDDMLVETQVMTDQAIISNGLMRKIIEEGSSFNCSGIAIEGRTVKYNSTEVIDVVSQFASISGPMDIDCDDTKKSFRIEIRVPQIPDKNYDVIIDYKL